MRNSEGYHHNTGGVVVAVLALPPPINGQTIINESIVSGLKRSTRVAIKLVDTSPRNHRRTRTYHFRRIIRTCFSPLVLLYNTSYKKRSFYTVIEPGLGMFYNFLTVTFARLFGYKLFLHHHASSYIKSYDLRFATLCRLAGERSLHIVLSEQMAKDLKLHYNSAQTVVAHNASHILACEKHERIDKNGMLTMGFLSNLTIEKGLDTVLDAFESIYSDGLDAQLLLAGPIVDERAHALIAAARLKFGDALIELGSVSGEAKDRFFSSIDLFLFPSRYRFEAQPLVILEALSHGVAVLATDHGYIQEIISPLGTGVGASDFISFTDRYVREWTRDETFRCSQRAAARCRFLELANEAKCQEISLYQLIAGDQSTSAG